MTSLSPAVADAARSRWPDRAAAWIDALPRELAELCDSLAVTPTGRTFPAGSAHVVEAATGTGARVVLRSTPDPDAAAQAAVLERLADAGLAPAVHGVRHTEAGTWTAMDAITPGTSFAEREPTPSNLTAVTTMLRTLSAEDGPPSVPSVVPWLRARLVDLPADDQPPHRGAALDMLDQLAAGSGSGLCHADLSPRNVLHGDSRLWFIGPRGMNGEAAYDVAVLALELSFDDLHTAHALARSIALTSGLDGDRASAWVTVVAAATV
ncbi:MULTISPECIES: phosphotransferase [Pseudonocardia]|uniref:Phosphotransferase enzyme family protein n=2 Tax=Pseudonocardia TaxID=1847 RepID=A0A1Y2MTZ2_PSEAH|nr:MULTISPECIES: phosphotransferase [Pseudonocardia]OSY38662.1 Phosphotransferase enzyme family protein [Pseudonocardia autotrophica]TDN74865.1 streptomycin 6-kinase [Pseudonocardia autotrophica]BBF98803.1 hypothetical protein Pdca_00130 [Pseudonocardia autotrophica]GEC26521.1 hypothetical protein PSA01_35500 [Pseudonocardia saturnea]